MFDWIEYSDNIEPSILREHIKSGADINAKVISSRRHILQFVAQHGRDNLLDVIISEYNFPVDEIGALKKTALMQAASDGHWNVVQPLLDEYGADPMYIPQWGTLFFT